MSCPGHILFHAWATLWERDCRGTGQQINQRYSEYLSNLPIHSSIIIYQQSFCFYTYPMSRTIASREVL
jgi:hypothetical protein